MSPGKQESSSSEEDELDEYTSENVYPEDPQLNKAEDIVIQPLDKVYLYLYNHHNNINLF